MARLNITDGMLKSKDMDQIQSSAGANAVTQLMSDIIDLYETKKSYDDWEDLLDKKKLAVLNLMSSLNVDSMTSKGVKCSLCERINKNIDTDGLLEYCKSLNIDGLVKTVEIVDMDKLEDLLYHKTIESEPLDEFIVKTESKYVKISGKLKG